MQPAPSPTFNAGRSQLVWNDLIYRYGLPAKLRQQGLQDRWITAIVAQYSSLERQGMVSNPMDRKAVVSAISPDTGGEVVPPPSEKDVYVRLKFDDQGVPSEEYLLKIVAPPRPVESNGKTLYWQLQVRR
jgi:hypothetical protein